MATQRPQIVSRQPKLRWGFASEVVSELKKVVWPSREEATRLTVMVIVISVAVGAALGLIDIGLSRFIRFIV
ncbi:MAG: preprotein translocase subunit SecE [Chloroflexi bacterium]|nr:preprotein translocase subunit SecE [Chloroflexota bacterium]